MTIRVLIADNHPLVRNSLQQLLSREPDMVPRSIDGHRQFVMEALENAYDDVIVLDSEGISYIGTEWLERQLKRLRRQVKLIVMSQHTERHYVDQSFRMGAAGYLIKSSAYEELPGAVRCVSQGNRYIGREITDVPECRPISIT